MKKMIDRMLTIAHPSPGRLVSWLDDELDPDHKQRVTLHLAHCSVCRGRLDQLQEGLSFFSRSVEMPPGSDFRVEEGLAKLMATIQRTEGEKCDDVPAPSRVALAPLYGRILSELSIYLGPVTAMQLLSRCDHADLNRDRLTTEIEPVVTTFLGQHAGSAVLANVLRIWDRTQQVAG